MFETIWQIILLILPAALANMAPVIFSWVPFFNVPVDFNYKIGGKPILGNHKTWRGLFSGIFLATVGIYLEKILFNYYPEWAILNYGEHSLFVWGVLFGVGALGGDMLKSFFKRRVGVEPGKSWVPFDQIDWIFGSLVLVSFVQMLSWEIWVLAIIIFGLLHPIFNLLSYYLGIKNSKF